MKLTFGKLVSASAAGSAQAVGNPVVFPERSAPRARIVPEVVLMAEEMAVAKLRAADQQAQALLGRAEEAAARLKLEAVVEARAELAAEFGARTLALAEREARADERGLDRSVQLARILAERLLGEELRLEPERIVALARQALAEARGTSRISIEAHPADAQILEQHLRKLGVLAEVTRIVSDERRSQGQLRIETDLGVLDAEISPQLERLSAKLKEALKHGGTPRR